MTYPVKITEVPHRGKVRVWELLDEDHLAECVAQASRMHGYEGACDLDEYLDWLQHDLSNLIVEKTEG